MAGARVDLPPVNTFGSLVLGGGANLAMKRLTVLTAIGVVLAGMSTAYCDTVLLNETFDTYADTAAMQAVWVGTDNTLSRIADNSNNPAAFPAAGQGVEHVGGAINVWNGLSTANALHPTATQSIR